MKSKRQRRRLHLECLEDRRLLASLQTAASFTLDSQAVADVDTKQVNALGEKARTYAASSYKQQYAKATSNGDAYSNTHTSGIRAELSTYLSNTDSKSPAVAVAAKASGTLSVQILPDERDAIGEQVWVKYQLDYDDIYFGIPYDPSEVPSLFAQATATSTAGIKFEHRTDNSVDYPGASELYTGVVRETVGSTVGISFRASIVGNSYTDRTHYKKIEPSVQISVISIPDDLKAFDLKANKLTLTGMNAHQQLEFNIEMEGDKVGSSKVDVAFYWANGSGADQRIGEPAGMMELDIKAWKAGVYKLAFPYDQLDKTHAASASHLQLVIDPYFEIGDRSLLNNFTDIEIYPLVVNVITHGWDSPVSLCDPTNTGDILEPFRAIADKLDAMPDQDSEYYGRVASYIPRWDSNDGFSSAIFSLAWAEVAEYLKLHYQDQFDFIAAGIAAYVSDLFEADARRASRRSALQGELAARRITQEIIDTYLLDSDASNKLQKIQLIGHSRALP